MSAAERSFDISMWTGKKKNKCGRKIFEENDCLELTSSIFFFVLCFFKVQVSL